jgi:hypothetical protein
LLSQTNNEIAGEGHTTPANEGHAALDDEGRVVSFASMDCALKTEGEASRPAGHDNATEV